MQEDIFDNEMDNDTDNDSEMDMEVEIYTLTDEDGNERDFELLGRHDADGQSYVALAAIDPDENGDGGDFDEDSEEEGSFIVLKVVEEDGEEVFETIENDEEFDRIADIFEDELMQDMEYDGEESEESEDDEE